MNYLTARENDCPPPMMRQREVESRSNTVTRVDLTQAVHQKLGLSSAESRQLVEQVLGEITACVVRGETVRLSGFGSFSVRRKGLRVGRNPMTRVEALIAPRRVMVFKASNILKRKVNAALAPPTVADSVAARQMRHPSPADGGG